MTRKYILLVDDNPSDQEMALEALDECGLRQHVVVASDGAEALDYLHRRAGHSQRTNGAPSVILLDVKMPKIDGLEVLRQVKGEPTLKSIPVVMLTSSREESDLVRSYALGANAYVVKPQQYEAFISAMKSMTSLWLDLNEPPPDQQQGP